MTFTDRNIIEAYSKLFDGLITLSKIELIDKLTKSMKREKKSKDSEFYKSFGAFGSNKNADEIIDEIKKSRNFRDKALKF